MWYWPFDACKHISLQSATVGILHCKEPPQGRALTQTAWTRPLAITIALQWASLLTVTVPASLIAGSNGAWSGFLGGVAIALPNAGLAAFLWLKARHVRVLSKASLMLGELVKLLCTLVALYLAARWLGAHAVWPALISGVICALKAQWLAVWFTRND
ncbi:MAG: ATP synthase subunit I [Gammaproteobacteria bacterium]|nr:ATP synthase subunit I [Gammaproteobacteria bacterium]